MNKRLVFPAVWLGIIATIGQILLLRESLVLFYGNELCIGLMLAGWLLWVALGSLLGTKITAITHNRLQRLNPEIIGTKTFLFLLFLINLTLPASLLLFRGLRIILHIPPAEMFTFLQISGAIILCQSLFPFSLGLMFSFYCSLVDSAKEVGKIYLYESLGALIGGTIYTFYLVKTFDPFTIWVGLFALSVFAYYSYFRQPKDEQEIPNSETENSDENLNLKSEISDLKSPTSLISQTSIILFLCVIAILLSITDIGPRLNKLSTLWRWNKQELIESKDSVYGNIAVTAVNEQKNIYSDGTLLYSIPNPIDDETFAHLSLLEYPQPNGKRILLLGGGGGSVLRELLKYQPTEVVYLELDPMLIQVMQKYLPSADRAIMQNSHIRIINQDGRRYLKQTKDQFDFIIVNITDPKSAMVNRYYTQEFFNEVKQRLLPNGVFGIGLVGGEAYLGQELLNLNKSIEQTLHSVFANIIIIPGDRNLYFACDAKNVISDNRDFLITRWKSRNIPTQYFNEYMLETVVQPDRVQFLKNQLQQASLVPLNHDLLPIAYFYNLQVWLKQSKGILQTVFADIAALQFRSFVFVMSILILVILFGIRWIHKPMVRKKIPLITIAVTTGTVGITLELIFVYAFQAFYGYVYQWIGLIIAIFMSGLAGGSFFGMRSIGNDKVLRNLFITEIVIVAFCLVLPWVLVETEKLNAALFILPGLTFITGVLVGIEYPWCVSYFQNKSEIRNQYQAGGVIYSSDLVGSACGALFATVFLIPLFGIIMTLYMMVVIKIGSLLILWRSKF